MKTLAALENVHRLFVETAPLIYFIEQHSTYFDRMDAIMCRIDAGDLVGVSSVITLTEVLTLPIKANRPEIQRAYQDILLHSRYFTLVPIISDIAIQAAELRSRYSLKTPDALQLAAAIWSSCDAFLTNDLTLRRVREIPVIALETLTGDQPKP